MIDTMRELFPVQTIGPAIGGLALWFGANAAYIGPQILAPRIAEHHFIPACMANVKSAVQKIAEAERSLVAAAEARIEAARRQLPERAQMGAGSFIEGFFRLYGRDGDDYLRRHGGTLTGSMGRMIRPLAEQEASRQAMEARQMVHQELERRRERLLTGVHHASPSAYCGCLVAESFSHRLDLAAYTASFRLYEPALIAQRRAGSIPPTSAACGNPPLLAGR